MATKVKKVKWAVSGTEPEDLAEFLDNDDIVKKNGKKLPAKGVYRLRVRRMYVKPNKNQDDRVSVMLIMDEPKKSKASSYNGYLVRDGFNITEQGTPFLKRFLKGLGLSWDDFYNKSKEVEDGDRRELVQIGGTKFGSQETKEVHVRALLRESPADDYNDSPYMDVQRYLPADEDDEPDEPEDDAAEDMGDDEPEVEPEDDRPTLDDLQSMKPKALKQVLVDQGVKQKKIDKAAAGGKEDLVEAARVALGLPPF
jgi:hypothetical protein